MSLAVQKPIRGLYAIRCRPAAEAGVIEAIRPFGSVQQLKRHHLLLLQTPPAKAQVAALSKLRALHRTGAVEFFTPVLRDQDTHSARILTDEIVVRFKPDVPVKQRVSLQRKLGVRTLRRNEFVPHQCVVKVSKPTGLETLRVATSLDKSDEVEFATPNFISQYRR